MRADLSTIQQTLTPEAAAALARAIDEAARRRHGQTTPLHVAAALLAAPAGLLRQACARAAAAGAGPGAAGGGAGSGGAHPLQCRALELCFSVALDRLPAAASAAAAAAQGAGPPVSNALVAALKRAQAQQRRGCPEAAQQPLLAVKVELEQLVLSILDDPSVSRVMREASFSSSAVKSTIEQSLSAPSPAAPSAAVPAVSTPTLAATTPLSPSPSSLSRVGNANTYINPRLAAAGGGGGDDACKVLDVMLKPARRNPVLVGDAGPDAVLKEAVRRIPTAGSPALAGAKVLPLEAELAKLAGDKAAMAARIGDLAAVVERLLADHSAVVLDLGDLKWLVEGLAAAASDGGKAVVSEMARLLRRFGSSKVWAVGTAACATYLRCKVYHPTMEAEWDLQAVPIARGTALTGAALRPGGTGILGNSVGMLSPTLRPMPVTPTALRWPPGAGSDKPLMAKPAMCLFCKGSYDRELAKLAAERKDKPASRPEVAKPGLPHWLQPNSDQPQTKEQELKWKETAQELEKKWRETCAQTHGTHAGAPALSMPLAAFGPRPPIEPKLQLARVVVPTLKMNTNWEKAEGTPTSELRKCPPGSPVKTDLVLGPLDPGATVDKDKKENYTEGLTAMQKAKIAGISDIESFKRLLKGLTEKVSWQSDAASAIAAVVIQCRSGSGKRRNIGTRGDMWLLFVGPDQAGKRKMVNALSELMVNTQPVIVNFGGDSRLGKDGNGLNAGFRGKTSLDRVTEAVRQSPFSVIVLEGIDQVDTVLRAKIKRAMEMGRLSDSRGREVSLGNVIFVLTTNWLPEELKGPKFETLLQDEGRMFEVANSNWQLELSVGDKQVKHRADWLCDDARPAKVAKELSGGHGLSLDLNLAVGALDDTEGSRNSSDLSVEQEQERGHLAVKCITPAPDSDLLNLVDDAIVFRPVDFGLFRKNVTDCIAAKFESLIGSSNSFRIDEDAIDRMAGSIWLTDEKLEDWAEKVLMPSIERLWRNTKHHNGRAVVRLAAAVRDKALPRWGGGREGLPVTVPIAIDGM
ncbi:Protein SMAX1-like [Dichanthelium oligosanthes]|uniref:Protein SMAX1-like n=1 Tax=Dichanthelium oligosanthes TaxID=888268 RepID=A0A1E5WC28_9POAL|nr:Protein SMAX1-like [Dichanthelium oligosanthes]